jgi:ribosome maturation factor RimP
MNREGQIQAISDLVNSLIGDDPGYFLVEVSIKPVNNIKVYLDADTGVVIERCVAYNRKLCNLITESGLFPEGEFSLEVSSPGIDEPLKLHRQYVKNTGRQVEITRNEGDVLTGLLKAVSDTEITLLVESGKNKKKTTTEHIIPFSNIKTTRIQIVF